MLTNGETVQEIKFWLELEAELHHIEDQLKTPEGGKYKKKKNHNFEKINTYHCIECTLALLRQGRRFITTTAFDTDTIGLKKLIERGLLASLFPSRLTRFKLIPTKH